MRYLLKLSYSGAAFCGWQRQPSAPSVQECLEDALGKLLGGEVPVIGAGRTDTGVNAIGYVACFDGPEGLAAEDFRYKLNAILPRSVVVSCVAPARADFHPRFDAVRREYTYFIHREKDPFVEAFSWQCGYPELSFEAMNEAAALLLGTHDFSCFEKAGADNKTSICTVFEAFWKPYAPTHASVMQGLQPPEQGSLSAPLPPRTEPAQKTSADSTARSKGPGEDPQGAIHPGIAPPNAFAGNDQAEETLYWYFRIAADRFLRNMVRAIVGTLIEVGRGKRSVPDFARLILPAPPEQGSLSAPLPLRTEPAQKTSAYRIPDSGDQLPNTGPSLRSLAGESVPGHALFLSKVEY
jgi:tRNA pseudouridine38-40 synthase